MAKKYRGSSVKRGNLVEMYGVSELLKKIEAAGGKVDEAVKKAVDNSLEQVGMEMQLFMLGHRLTGETKDSYEQKKAVSEDNGNKVTASVGYNVKEGGLPAIFLDVGTPKQKPHFFRYYAVENSRKHIEEAQRHALEEVLEDLQ